MRFDTATAKSPRARGSRSGISSRRSPDGIPLRAWATAANNIRKCGARAKLVSSTAARSVTMYSRARSTCLVAPSGRFASKSSYSLRIRGCPPSVTPTRMTPNIWAINSSSAILILARLPRTLYLSQTNAPTTGGCNDRIAEIPVESPVSQFLRG